MHHLHILLLLHQVHNRNHRRDPQRDPRAPLLQLVRRDGRGLRVDIPVQHAARVEERCLCRRWEPHAHDEGSGGDLQADVESIREDGGEGFAEESAVGVGFEGGFEALEECICGFSDLVQAPGGEGRVLYQFEDGIALGLGEAAAEVKGGFGLDFAVEVVDLGVVVRAEAFDDLDLEEVAFDPVDDESGDEEVAGARVADEGGDVLW